MRTQEQIDAATASRVGHTAAEKGKSRRIMAKLLVFTLDQTREFFEGLPKIFPQLGEISVKSLNFDHHEHGPDCDHDHDHDHDGHDHGDHEHGPGCDHDHGPEGHDHGPEHKH